MTFSNVAGVLLDLDGFDNSFAYLHGGGTTGGDITLDGATLTVTTGTAAPNFGGVISGAGAFVMNGERVQRLSGCDSSYTGTTTINAGSLYVNCLVHGQSSRAHTAYAAHARHLGLKMRP